MKLSITNLESLRNNPNMLHSLLNSSSFRRTSRKRVLQYAIYYYHRQHENLDRALEHLDNMYARFGFHPVEGVTILQDQLSDYANAYQALGYTNADVKIRAQIKVGEDILFTGEIPRLDMTTTDGYLVCMMADDFGLWRSELRMPIIQSYFADKMKVDLEKVAIGLYSLKTAQYDIDQFDRSSVEEAWVELEKLGVIPIRCDYGVNG